MSPLTLPSRLSFAFIYVGEGEEGCHPLKKCVYVYIVHSLQCSQNKEVDRNPEAEEVSKGEKRA